jgi:hypothetical protein
LEEQFAAVEPKPPRVLKVKVVSRQDLEEIRTLDRPDLFEELLERRFEE